ARCGHRSSKIRTGVRFGPEMCPNSHDRGRRLASPAMPALTVPVDAGPRRLGALADTAGEEAVAAVLAAAEPLRGLRVAHLATPPFAPGALDRLRSTV